VQEGAFGKEDPGKAVNRCHIERNLGSDNRIAGPKPKNVLGLDQVGKDQTGLIYNPKFEGKLEKVKLISFQWDSSSQNSNQ
jgi:hypothetical protein